MGMLLVSIGLSDGFSDGLSDMAKPSLGADFLPD
jgi:hypothetical protein